MTVTVKARRLSTDTTPGAVAGAAGSSAHELSSKKFHKVRWFFFCRRRCAQTRHTHSHPTPTPPTLRQTEAGYNLCLDALGAETEADIELGVFDAGDGEGGDNTHSDILLKLGSGATSVMRAPPDADPASCEGVLEGGQFKLSLAKKEKNKGG